MNSFFGNQRLKAVLILGNIAFVVGIVFLAILITQELQGFSMGTTSNASTLPPEVAATTHFTTLPLGAKLPTESNCAARVRRSSSQLEIRPDNTLANQSIPTARQIAALSPWGPAIGESVKADSLRKQISGNFTGTTDDILRWVACKWGIDEDIVRAEAVAESSWHQNQRGDQTSDRSLCAPETWDGKECYQSYGILQIKYYYNQSTWPMSRNDTAFNAEYVYGILRACFEGWTTYLTQGHPVTGYPSYHAGDIWGCLGRWYSGWWYTQNALQYIASVKQHLANKEWQQPGF